MATLTASNLCLLSIPGEGDIRYVLEACRPHLQAQTEPLVAYLPWASTGNDWLAYTQQAFAGLACVAQLDPVPGTLAENTRILDRCGVVYIPGGNTYLLNHRLHESGLLHVLRSRALNGLPVVGFSAGAVVCGPNILTTHDINMLPTAHFEGLNLLPYNLVAHYPADDVRREHEDDWLSDYHVLHTNPILALEDDACVHWSGAALEKVRGTAWMLEPGRPRAQL